MLLDQSQWSIDESQDSNVQRIKRRSVEPSFQLNAINMVLKLSLGQTVDVLMTTDRGCKTGNGRAEEGHYTHLCYIYTKRVPRWAYPRCPDSRRPSSNWPDSCSRSGRKVPCRCLERTRTGRRTWLPLDTWTVDRVARTHPSRTAPTSAIITATVSSSANNGIVSINVSFRSGKVRGEFPRRWKNTR